MLPFHVTEMLQAITADSLQSTPRFRVQLALRKQLSGDNIKVHFSSPRRLSASDIESIVLAPTLDIAQAMTDAEVELVAKGLAQAYEANVAAYSAAAFENPVRPALEAMRRIRIQF